MRWLRRIGLGLLALLGVVVIGLVVLVATFDANAYRDDIARAVEQRTGRELAIQGELSLTLYPWLGLAVNEVRLANAPGFGQTPMAQVQRLHLAVRLLPLLSQRIEVGTVTVTGLRLDLQRNARGRTNWQDLVAGAPRSRVQPVAAGTGTRQVPDWLRQARLDALVVEQARIDWRDANAGQQVRIEDGELRLDDVRLGRAIPVEAGARIAPAQGLDADVDLSARVTAAADLSRVSVEELLTAVTASGAAIPAGRQFAELRGEAVVDLAAQRVVSEGWQLRWGPVTATGRASVDYAGAVAADARLKTEPFDPRKVMSTLGMTPPETTDPEALSRARLSADASYRDAGLAVTGLELELDASTLTGEVLLDPLSPPVVRADASVDRVNVDRYLAPETENTAATPGQAAAGGGAEAAGPLRTLDLDARLTVGELQASGVALSDVELRARARDGLLRVNPLRARLYQGQYSGDVTVDVRGSQPRIAVNERLTGIQLQPLLRDFLELEILRGTGDVVIDAEAVGTEAQGLLESAAGTLAFELRDGALKGLNIPARLRAGMAELRGASARDVAVKETDFTAVSGTARIRNGIVRNEDLSAQSPLLRVRGEGEANLLRRRLDYLLTVNVVGSLEGQGGETLDDLRGVPVPIRIRGPLLEPKISLALREAITEKQRLQAEEAKREAQEKLKARKQEAKEKARAEQEAAKEKLQDKQEAAKSKLQDKGEEAKQQLQDLLRR